jgi:hypothetical protein
MSQLERAPEFGAEWVAIKPMAFQTLWHSVGGNGRRRIGRSSDNRHYVRPALRILGAATRARDFRIPS